MAKNDKNEESDLDRIALEEIIKEAKRGKERAETMGPMGWIKCPLVPTNKRFFRNVLMGTLANQKRDNGIKEKKHQRQSLAKNHVRLTSDSPSSSHSSSGDKSIERKTKDKYERSEQSYSPLKYSNEATCGVQKALKDKYKRSTKDNVTDKKSYHSHSRRCDEEKDNCNKKSKQSRRDDVTERRSYRSHSHERYDDEKPGMERNQSRKHKLEEHKKQHKYHKHTKKRKE